MRWLAVEHNVVPGMVPKSLAGAFVEVGKQKRPRIVGCDPRANRGKENEFVTSRRLGNRPAAAKGRGGPENQERNCRRFRDERPLQLQLPETAGVTG